MKTGSTERKTSVVLRVLAGIGLLIAIAAAGFWAGARHGGNASLFATSPAGLDSSPVLPLAPTLTAPVSASATMPARVLPSEAIEQGAAVPNLAGTGPGTPRSPQSLASGARPFVENGVLPNRFQASASQPWADGPLPSRPAGLEAGIPIPRVRNGSLLALLGLKDGDQLIRVNGFDVRTPEQALQAYAVLRRADRLVVEIRRADRLIELVYRIV